MSEKEKKSAPVEGDAGGKAKVGKNSENAESSAGNDDKGKENSKGKKNAFAGSTAFIYDKQHRDLIFYLAIAIFFLELIIAAVAFFYGVMHAEMDPAGGPPRFNFPWLAYAVGAFTAPAALLLIVHLAGVGLFRSWNNQEGDETWRRDLPERMRKVYAVIQAAPTVVLLCGVMLIGAALFYIDGAMNALFRLGAAAEKYLPFIIGGIVVVWGVGYVARIWLDYRTRRLAAEYEFRREVMEKTGIIIVEKGSMPLPPGTEASITAIGAGGKPELPGGGGEAGSGGAEVESGGPGEGQVIDVVISEKRS